MTNKKPWALLLIEAMDVASSFIGEDIRKDFLIIGGAALVKYGSQRYTRDIDIAITAETLKVFSDKAADDPRFSLHSDDHWVYTAQGPEVKGLQVEFEFLSDEGGYIPRIRGMTKFDPVWVASLADLAFMKASAFLNRSIPHDLTDLVYILRQMKKRDQTLAKYRLKQWEIKIIRAAVEGDAGGEASLLEVIE